MRLMMRLLSTFLWRWILLLLVPLSTAAHEVPDDVRIQAFFKPQGPTLQLLMRVPLAAMREVDFPRRGPGYVDLARVDAALQTAARQWLSDNFSVQEDGRTLPEPRLVRARVALPSDRSFTAFESALAQVQGPPLPAETDLYWNQGLLDVLFEYPITSDRAAFSIDPRFARLGLKVKTSVLVLLPQRAARAFELHGNPGPVELDPRWHQAALRFVQDGFLHILQGADHLLFIACLAIPLRRLRPLVVIVTAFTLAHSVTLIASALGWVPDGLWFPPLVETVIAASIVFMALDNVVGAATGAEVSTRRRWLVAGGFGLVHGFGFSFALRDSLQFAGDHVLSALLAFNVGVELGQLLVLVLLVPLLGWLFRFGVAERVGVIIVSALVAHTGWHWMIERGERLAQFPLPAVDAALLTGLLRAGMVAVVVVAVLWGWRSWRAGKAPR